MSKPMKTQPRYWLNLSQIEGHFAMWAVRQSPYHCPDNLGVVLAKFRERALGTKLFDEVEMAQLSGKEVEFLLQTCLCGIPEYGAWNERKNGNKSPHKFVSRYYGKENPDDDFIDLDALTRNARMSLMKELESEQAPYESRVMRFWRRFFPGKLSVPMEAKKV